MATENQIPEVQSKEMYENSLETIDSKFASLNTTPRKGSEESNHGETTKLNVDISTLNGDRNHSIYAVLNGSVSSANSSNLISPEDLSADPMLASALMSPFNDPHNLDAMFSPINGSLQRAPSVIRRAKDVSNDWELYKRAGPIYPASLESQIMKYHKTHSNSWQLAHDLGAGSGVYAPTLARFFRHVHVSDPDKGGLTTSRKLLSERSSDMAKRRGRFTFSVEAPEHVDECVADASVDMAVVTECAHFTDAEAMVRSVAQTLSPGGTLAIITHRPICSVAGNEKASVAVQNLFDAWGSRVWDVACGTSTRSRQQYSLGLDFVPLPEDLYARDKTRRITINTHGRTHALFRVPDVEDESVTSNHMSTDEMMDMPCSRVDEKEKRHEFNEEDEQGRGWRQEVGWESFRTRIAMLDTPQTVARLEPHLKEVEEVIMRTSPNGVKIVVEWAVAIVLATRK